MLTHATSRRHQKHEDPTCHLETKADHSQAPHAAQDRNRVQSPGNWQGATGRAAEPMAFAWAVLREVRAIR